MRKILQRTIRVSCLVAVSALFVDGAGAENACSGSACSGSDSGCATGGFSNVLDQICGLAPGGNCLDRCGCCRDETTELFAGVTFASPTAAPPVWPGLGGRGRLAGEAELCLLRDLGKVPGGVVNEPEPISIGPLGSVKVKQRVGLTGFDPVGRTMQGFHSVRFCVPAFGCVDDQVQNFTAALFDSGAPNLDCGDYPFADAFGLRIATSDTERHLNVSCRPSRCSRRTARSAPSPSSPTTRRSRPASRTT